MSFQFHFLFLNKLPGSPAPKIKRENIKVEYNTELIILEKDCYVLKLAFSSEFYFKARI